jgi:ribosomal-protein-alanine N-acetyltransferase
MSTPRRESLSERIAIVEMHERDLDEVVAIERESGLSPWGRVGYLDELWNQEAILLIARQDGAGYFDKDAPALGFATGRMVTSAAEMHINNIAVGLSFRRMGVGGRLLRALLARGRAMGAETALLEVRASNLAAHGLYQSFGFSVIGERRGYYMNPPENALVMRGNLTAKA